MNVRLREWCRRQWGSTGGATAKETRNSASIAKWPKRMPGAGLAAVNSGLLYAACAVDRSRFREPKAASECRVGSHTRSQRASR